MSEPLGKIFSTRTHYFWEKMSVQNKNLKFLSLVFWKINLSKLTLFFSNFSCYTKTYETIDRFFQILNSKKEKHMSLFYNFQNAHERIKDFNLSYHFL